MVELSEVGTTAAETPEYSGDALCLCGNLRGGKLSVRQRAEHAWSAACWARFVLEGRVFFFDAVKFGSGRKQVVCVRSRCASRPAAVFFVMHLCMTAFRGSLRPLCLSVCLFVMLSAGLVLSVGRTGPWHPR